MIFGCTGVSISTAKDACFIKIYSDISLRRMSGAHTLAKFSLDRAQHIKWSRRQLVVDNCGALVVSLPAPNKQIFIIIVISGSTQLPSEHGRKLKLKFDPTLEAVTGWPCGSTLSYCSVALSTLELVPRICRTFGCLIRMNTNGKKLNRMIYAVHRQGVAFRSCLPLRALSCMVVIAKSTSRDSGPKVWLWRMPGFCKWTKIYPRSNGLNGRKLVMLRTLLGQDALWHYGQIEIWAYCLVASRTQRPMKSRWKVHFGMTCMDINCPAQAAGSA